MANKRVLIDTSILIDYYRKTDKANSVWISLLKEDNNFSVSAITKYEIYAGATKSQLEFWDNIFRVIEVLPLNEAAVDAAVNINAILKLKRKQIDLADLFIAATAISNKLPFATLNMKHFERIETLDIVKIYAKN